MYQQKIELFLTNCKGITISQKKVSLRYFLKRLFYQQEKFLILLQSFISCSNFVTSWLVQCSPISLFATYIHYIHKA